MCRARILSGRRYVIRIAGSYTTAYITNEASKVYALTADANGSTVDGYPVSLPIVAHGITDVNQQNICGASSPAVATVEDVDYLLFGCDDGWLYRLRLSDRDLSCVNLNACVESSPTVVGSEVFVGVSRNNWLCVYRVSVAQLAIVAQRAIGQECRATLACSGECMYLGVDTGTTFRKLWRSTLLDAAVPFDDGQTGFFVGSAALSTAGVAYVGNDNGSLYALSASDLSQIAAYATYSTDSGWTRETCSSPALGYNADAGHSRWVYVVTRTNGGKLWAFKTAR